MFLPLDSAIPLLPTSEISSFNQSSVAVQPVCIGPDGGTLKTGFLTTRLI